MNSMWRCVVKLGRFRYFFFFCELVKHKMVRWWGEDWGISAELQWGMGSISRQEDAVIARGALMSPAGLKHSSSSKSQTGGLLSLIGKGLAPDVTSNPASHTCHPGVCVRLSIRQDWSKRKKERENIQFFSNNSPSSTLFGGLTTKSRIWTVNRCIFINWTCSPNWDIWYPLYQ